MARRQIRRTRPGRGVATSSSGRLRAGLLIVAAGSLVGIAWNAVRDNGIWAPIRPTQGDSTAVPNQKSGEQKRIVRTDPGPLPVTTIPAPVPAVTPAPSPAPAAPVQAPAPTPVPAPKPTPPPVAPVRVIELLEARTLAAQGTALFVDARSANHFNLGHIPRAINLPNNDFDATYPRVKQLLPPPAQIVVYCTSTDCDEAELVIARLIPLGYRRLLHFKGGWNDWENARLPSETGPGPGGRLR